MIGSTKLEKALKRGCGSGGDLVSELRALRDYNVSSRRDAIAICNTLSKYPFPRSSKDGDRWVPSPLHSLLALFQQVDNKEAFSVLASRGVQELVRILDQARASLTPNIYLFLLKILALCRNRDGTDRIVRAIEDESEPDGYLWSVVLHRFDGQHPDSAYLCETIGEHFPRQGFLAVAYLDFLNRLALSGVIPHHPFDSDDGLVLLTTWLRESDPDRYSYARSATTCLSFLTRPEREYLLTMALNHPSTEVQMEAAWAQARIGQDEGISRLATYCLDPKYSVVACRYLDELDRSDAIPLEVNSPDFRAMAEMCLWLAHPMEYGHPPDEIELYDTRELHWPPTSDRRQVWLFKYTYRSKANDQEDDIGIGMVGSVTFALFGEATKELSPKDVYALHCCWELQVNNDPRAPEERSIEIGRKILRQSQ